MILTNNLYEIDTADEPWSSASSVTCSVMSSDLSLLTVSYRSGSLSHSVSISTSSTSIMTPSEAAGNGNEQQQRQQQQARFNAASLNRQRWQHGLECSSASDESQDLPPSLQQRTMMLESRRATTPTATATATAATIVPPMNDSIPQKPPRRSSIGSLSTAPSVRKMMIGKRRKSTTSMLPYDPPMPFVVDSSQHHSPKLPERCDSVCGDGDGTTAESGDASEAANDNESNSTTTTSPSTGSRKKAKSADVGAVVATTANTTKKSKKKKKQGGGGESAEVIVTTKTKKLKKKKCTTKSTTTKQQPNMRGGCCDVSVVTIQSKPSKPLGKRNLSDDDYDSDDNHSTSSASSHTTMTMPTAATFNRKKHSSRRRSSKNQDMKKVHQHPVHGTPDGGAHRHRLKSLASSLPPPPGAAAYRKKSSSSSSSYIPTSHLPKNLLWKQKSDVHTRRSFIDHALSSILEDKNEDIVLLSNAANNNTAPLTPTTPKVSNKSSSSSNVNNNGQTTTTTTTALTSTPLTPHHQQQPRGLFYNRTPTSSSKPSKSWPSLVMSSALNAFHHGHNHTNHSSSSN